MTDFETALETLLRERFGGIISHGKHPPDGAACALELVSQAKGLPWTDDPRTVGYPDLRSLNDAGWVSDAARTTALLPVLIALSGWPDWSKSRRITCARIVALRTIREVLPIALRAIGLDGAARRCETAGTLKSAWDAARDAAGTAGTAAWDAARDAAGTAGTAAWDAAWDAAGTAGTAAWAAGVAAEAAWTAAWTDTGARSAEAAAWTAAGTAMATGAGKASGEAVLILSARIWVEAAATGTAS
jgi:hypothetical protein